jgi:hypothetical protein
MIGYDAHTPHVSTRFRHDRRRAASRLLATLGQLEHEAALGESTRTPAILVAAMAICMWTLAAILVATAMAAAALLTH